ncbi:MAG: YhdH/YhfP family quinone oxidoreductase [Pseudomonadota bacterium]
MTSYRAFRVERDADKNYSRHIATLDSADLPDGELLVDVRHSSLNYKDALSATGNPGVTRNFPHTPGIDAAGTVLESASDEFAAGDDVIVIGFDLGMGTPGGYGERIRVPAGWAVKRPSELTERDAMIIGTAGFTAALCVHKLEAAGLAPGQGPVLVTGASGGVGSISVMLLAQLGYEVAAVTGKTAAQDLLRTLGASSFLTREEAAEGAAKPLLGERWAGVVDTVGGEILFNAIKSLRYGGSLAACGLVASPQVDASVLPFILRHVNWLGVDSVQLPVEQKAAIWRKLAADWRLESLDRVAVDLTLEDLSPAIDKILAGDMIGRGIVTLQS